MQATDGKLYGLTSAGGTFGGGTFFSFDPSTLSHTVLANFGPNYYPYGTPTQASDGKIYGVTNGGGALGVGTIFSYNIATATFTSLNEFNGINGGRPYNTKPLNYTQTPSNTTSNIFKGGIGDGWHSLNFAQANTSNIFKGGIGDGWHSLNFAQASSNIFKGGIGDGWHSLNFAQASSNIFKGGVGDGWASQNYLQSSTNIFKGGTGDGWASAFSSSSYISSITDYFRTRASGNWNNVSTWESSPDNFAWYPATRFPTDNAAAIKIMSTHTVTVTENIVITQTTINPGGSVVVNAGVVVTVK
jgi:uncharacterized repeat protein (TIGR03803 family)